MPQVLIGTAGTVTTLSRFKRKYISFMIPKKFMAHFITPAGHRDPDSRPERKVSQRTVGVKNLLNGAGKI